MTDYLQLFLDWSEVWAPLIPLLVLVRPAQAAILFKAGDHLFMPGFFYKFGWGYNT